MQSVLLDDAVGVDITTSSASSINNVVQNKLAIVYAESSQFHDTNKEIMALREQTPMHSEEIPQFSTSFPWQVFVYMCMYVCAFVFNYVNIIVWSSCYMYYKKLSEKSCGSDSTSM